MIHDLNIYLEIMFIIIMFKYLSTVFIFQSNYMSQCLVYSYKYVIKNSMCLDFKAFQFQHIQSKYNRSVFKHQCKLKHVS